MAISDIFKSKKAKQKFLEDKYLEQFKKTYEQRTVAEKIIVDGLYKLETQDSESCGYTRDRLCGAIEATLLMVGFLTLGKDFDRSPKESYREVVIRLGYEYLTSTNCI